MLYQFVFGKSRWGGWRCRHIPVYYMLYWQLRKRTRDRVVYRPSTRTLGHLLGISGMALFVLVLLTWNAGFPWAPASGQAGQPKPAHTVTAEEIQQLRELTEKLKQNLTPDARAELERKWTARGNKMQHRVEQNKAVRRTGRIVMTILYWTMYGSLCAVMVLPLAAYPFEWLTIQRSGNDLIVRKHGVWSVTRRWPVSTFGQIFCYVDAEYLDGDSDVIVGWRWMVKLGASDKAWTEQEPSLVDDPEVVFFIDYQEIQPSNDRPLPGSVSKLTEHLQSLTGIKPVVRGEVSGGRVTQRYPMATKSKITRHVAHSLEEVPEELRPKAEQMFNKIGNNKGPAVQHSFRATVRDSNGNMVVYHSLEEMPSELRTRYKDAIQRAKRDQPPS